MVRSRLFSLACLALASAVVFIVGSLTGAAPFSDIVLTSAYAGPIMSAAIVYALPFHLQVQIFAAFVAAAALAFTLASKVDRATRFRRFEPTGIRNAASASG